MKYEVQNGAGQPQSSTKRTETRVRGERTRVLAPFLASRGLGVDEDNL